MKSAFFLVLLAVVACQAAVVPDVKEVAAVVPDVKEDAAVEMSASRANMEAGWLQPGDRLLYRTYLRRYPINNAIQYQDFNYRGAANTRINLVRAIEVGQTQWGRAWITQGGVGWNSVTVRVQSNRGWGFYYMIEVWGR